MVKRFAKSLIGEERLAVLRFEWQFALDRKLNRPVLFVHQMGKVGSTSVSKTIRNFDSDKPWRIYQTHFLSNEGMALVERLNLDGYGRWANMPVGTKRTLTRSRSLSKHIYHGDFSTRRRKVISLVRDPVATNLSGFFHNYRWWPVELIEKCRSRTPGFEHDLLKQFLEQYPHTVPEDWFDMEMKEVFGVDVFAESFDIQAGYKVYDDDSYPLLLLRLENLNKIDPQVLGDFLDLDSFVLRRSNTASDKWYAEAYSHFKKAVVLPESYLDQMYGSPMVLHFYAPDEINKFREKWKKTESVLSLSSEG